MAARRRRRRLLGFAGAALIAGIAALAVTAGPRLWEGMPSLDAVDAQATAVPQRHRVHELALAAERMRARADRSGGKPRQAHRAAPSLRDANRARRFADSRAGSVSFAVIGPAGRMRSAGGRTTYISASAVKSLLLAAELRRLDSEGAPLDQATRETLRAMITYSDNDAADSIYYRVGDAGMTEVAARAGMMDFYVAGYWGSAQITAEDMARFFFRLDRAFAGAHPEFGKGLLGSVVSEQRWGIPAAAGEHWNVRFKGGWRSTDFGELTHQAAELRRDGDRISIAVLTDAQPSQAYGQETVRGVADRLLPG